MTYNSKLAKILFEIADVLEMKGVEWKPQAYRKAAFAISDIDDLRQIYKKDGIAGLKKIPGVGVTIASKIEEYIKTGRMKKHDQLTGKIPKGLLNLVSLPGLGPKRAEKLYYKLKIKSIPQLKKAAEQGRIRKLEGFSSGTEKEILETISLGLKTKERRLTKDILPVANQLLKAVKSWPEVQRAELAGSIRREEPTIGDIDIIASSETPSVVTSRFAKLPQVRKVIAQGPTKAAVWLSNNFEADIRVVNNAVYGAALQYFTGPKNFNIKLRKLAIRKGYKLSEYGLFDRKTGELVAGKTELEIFRKLGLPYIKSVGERNKFQ